jgi:hypothetical protein
VNVVEIEVVSSPVKLSNHKPGVDAPGGDDAMETGGQADRQASRTPYRSAYRPSPQRDPLTESATRASIWLIPSQAPQRYDAETHRLNVG